MVNVTVDRVKLTIAEAGKLSQNVFERERLTRKGLEIDRKIYEALLAAPQHTLPPLT